MWPLQIGGVKLPLAVSSLYFYALWVFDIKYLICYKARGCSLSNVFLVHLRNSKPYWLKRANPEN